MKGLIITNGFTVSLSMIYKTRRLKEEFELLGVSIDHKTTLEVYTYFQDGEMKVDGISDYDFCIFLDKDKYLSYAIGKETPLFNNASSIEACDDKMLTYLKLRGLDIKTPKTIPSPLCYALSPDPLNIDELVRNVEREISFPLVCKECYGSLGKQVYLIKNHEELVNIATKLIHVPHLYQEFIASSCGRDIRMLMISDECVASMERTNEKDFRSNIALGGVGKVFNPPEEYLKLAKKIVRELELDYAGIDLLVGENGEPILSEVNSNPFFTEIEKVTKVNVTRKLVKHILDKVNNKYLLSF